MKTKNLSKQQKNCYEKNKDKILIQKKNNRCIQFRDLVRSYLESENRLKALEDKADSKNNQKF